MTGLAILLLLAAMAHGISQRFRIPVIPLLLLSGLGLSIVSSLPFVTGMQKVLDPEHLKSILQLGLTFLIFAAGVELNPMRIGKQRRAAWWVGIVEFVVTGALGYLLAKALGFDGMSTIYLALALATSSTLIVLNQLRAWLRIYEPFARMVTGVLLIQDLLMIVCIVVMANVDSPLQIMIRSILGVIALGGLAMACQQFLMPWLVLRFEIKSKFNTQLSKGRPARLDGETMLLFVVAVLFAFIGLSKWMGIPIVAGAFFAGFSFSSFPLNGLVRGVTQSISGFFAALFFIALGALIVLPSPDLIIKGLILSLSVLVVTPPLVTFVAEKTGLTSRYAIESGLLLAQTSELSLVLSLAGFLMGHISNEVFSIISLISVITMSITPLIAHERTAALLLHWHPTQRRRELPPSDFTGHVIILGFGSGGMWVLKPLLKAGYTVVVVDDDPVIVQQLSRTDAICIRGDGADKALLKHINASEARIILSGMRRLRDAEQLLKHVNGVPVIVRVFEDHQAKAIEQLGGIPILNSEAACQTFMQWFLRTGITSSNPQA
ncbi:cation:proton antiporter [Verrucomicrobia bacterium]|nr:cation:proton antiporter [Verrucomicrobiota bacterium]